MALTIRALDRGGWSAYGGGHYDARNDAVVLQVWGEDEELSTTISFNESISSITKTEGGITSTTPSLSSGTATCELSNMENGGYVKFLATLASGQKKLLVIQANPRVASLVSDYGRGL